MKRWHWVGMMLAAMTAGFAGGAAAVKAPLVVEAQETIWPRDVRSQHFVVVDEAGRKRAEFGFVSRDKLVLRIYDERGRVIWSAPSEMRILPLETHP